MAKGSMTSNGWGGAVRLWTSKAQSGGSTLTLTTTRDLTYAGNKAGQGKTAGESGATALGALYEDMGGFAHLQGNTTLTLSAAANTTLTIGETGAAQTAGLDSITTSNGGNKLEISGAGTVNLNGSLEGFVGAINVNGGTVNMATGFGSIDNDIQNSANGLTSKDSVATVGKDLSVLTVGSGATVNMGALTINRSTKAIPLIRPVLSWKLYQAASFMLSPLRWGQKNTRISIRNLRLKSSQAVL